jgi:hypothetical protein
MSEITEHHKQLLKKYVPLLIDPLKEAARTHGYALAVHGSLQKDIDLIAVPWTEEAIPPQELAEVIRAKAEELTGYAQLKDLLKDDPYHNGGCPGYKPHSRLCWAFQLPGGPWIDLSVTPTSHVQRQAVHGTPFPWQDDPYWQNHTYEWLWPTA